MESIIPLIYGAIGCSVGVVGAWFTLRRAHPELQKLRLELDKLKLEKSKLEKNLKKETSPIWTSTSPDELEKAHRAATRGSALGGFKEKALVHGGAKDAAQEKISQSLDEFNESISAIRDLGFTVTDLKVGMGVTPRVSAMLMGTVASIKKEKVQELIEANQDNKFLITFLKALQIARDVQNKIGDLGFKGVEAEVNLVLPAIEVRFL